MAEIKLLDQNTIDKIAAGEVVERPASVVKELVENAIDAGASAITVEIKEGGIGFIRITDNGSGIEKKQVPLAFLRHSTSKIKGVEDLLSVHSLGFRGEALSSIAAVSQVELITKTKEDLTGIRYVIEGGKERSMEEIGAPDGTTFLVRNLFFNTPARRKFLKTPQTEGAYVADLMEKIALSKPEISFQFILNDQVKIHSSGNGNLKDLIYQIYGREIAANLIEVSCKGQGAEIYGYLGKPIISRGNRNFEQYYINGRYVRSKIVAKAIEDGYSSYMMQHKYPFVVLDIRIRGEELDVNVHPTKMELRLENQQAVYNDILNMVKEGLSRKELIPEVTIEEKKTEEKPEIFTKKEVTPQPFEVKRLESWKKENADKFRMPEAKNRESDEVKTPEADSPETKMIESVETEAKEIEPAETELKDVKKEPLWKNEVLDAPVCEESSVYGEKTKKRAWKPEVIEKSEQMELFGEKSEKFLDEKSIKKHQIIGQLFKTYWLVEMEDKFYMIDQHAAHEKVLYERMVKDLHEKKITSQLISPPMIISVSQKEENLLLENMEAFTELGFEIEHFGGKEYTISAIPNNLYGLAGENLFMDLLDSMATENWNKDLDTILEKLASMSCKAAVKGNYSMSVMEATALIDELMTLENPYHCPHGRPVIVSMSKYEIEKKFKRIV